MDTPESQKTESPRSIEEWVSQIEFSWKDIPDFRVEPDKFRHLAIICDGNRRAAKARGFPPYFGHRAGLEVLRGVAKACRNWGINHLTVWLWSTENWQRDREQVNFIMSLAGRYLGEEKSLSTLIENETKFVHVGRKDRFSPLLKETISGLENQTKHFNRHIINLAFDYGGLDEVARAVIKIAQDLNDGTTSSEDILKNPRLIYYYLDTSGQPLPDLVIRTGCEHGEIPHTSGFMPLQSVYSGWVYLPDLFPELTPVGLLKTIQEFTNYQMRKGK